jgi:hypothetical protein
VQFLGHLVADRQERDRLGPLEGGPAGNERRPLWRRLTFARTGGGLTAALVISSGPPSAPVKPFHPVASGVRTGFVPSASSPL